MQLSAQNSFLTVPYDIGTIQSKFTGANLEHRTQAYVVQTIWSQLQARYMLGSLRFQCDGCNAEPNGEPKRKRKGKKELSAKSSLRYQCTVCENFNLCVDCFGVFTHQHDSFYLYQLPSVPPPPPSKGGDSANDLKICKLTHKNE